MRGSPELLEFYLVEATEYLDALDQLIGSSGVSPDGNAFIATVRALRGTSTMAKADAVAELSILLEQIAHGLRDGELRWTIDLYQSLRHSVDDLRLLVRGIRTWGDRETARAESCAANLRRFLAVEPPRAATPEATATAPVFVALQASAIAAELDAFVNNPMHRRALDDALTRTRIMRGIAGIADLAPLADVADAIDKTARALMPDAPLADSEAELFRSASVVLRTASERLRVGGDPSDADEVDRFARAVRALEPGATAPAGETVVRIDELFYADDGPHVLRQASTPPVSADDRFRADIAGRMEHVRRLVGDARQVHDVDARDRVARDLRSVLLDIERSAASFGAHQVAGFFGGAARDEPLLHATLVEALDAGAALFLYPPGTNADAELPNGRAGLLTGHSGPGTLEEIERRLAVLERSRRRTPAFTPIVSARERSADALPLTPFTPPSRPSAPPEPFASPRAPGSRRPPPATPTGRDLMDLLQVGIAGFEPLENEPLSEPARLDEDQVVPVEDLLYRGQSALRRAVKVRDEMQARGTTDSDALQEIFDLLDLAGTEH